MDEPSKVCQIATLGGNIEWILRGISKNVVDKLCLISTDKEEFVQKIAEIQGGIAIANADEVLTSYSLPLGGQMSDEPFEELIEALKKVKSILNVR